MPTVRTAARLSALIAAGLLALLPASAHAAPDVGEGAGEHARASSVAVRVTRTSDAADTSRLTSAQPSGTAAPTTPSPSPATTTTGAPGAPSAPGSEEAGSAQDATTRFWALTVAGLLIAAGATAWSVRRVRAARERELAAPPGTGPDGAPPTADPDA